MTSPILPQSGPPEGCLKKLFRLLKGAFYVLVELSALSWAYVSFASMWRTKGTYFVEFNIAGATPGLRDKTALAAILQERVRQIQSDLQSAVNDPEQIRSTNALDPAFIYLSLNELVTLSRVTAADEMKLSVGGVDLNSVLAWAQKQCFRSKVLVFNVVDNQSSTTVSANLSSMFESQSLVNFEVGPVLDKIEQGGRSEIQHISASDAQIADYVAYEIVRLRSLEEAKANANQGATTIDKTALLEKLQWSSVHLFREDVLAYTTKTRVRRSTQLTAAAKDIQAHMVFAKHALDKWFQADIKIPSLQMLSDQSRFAYAQSQLPRLYFAPPSVRHFPDKTFQNMSLIYLSEGSLKAVSWNDDEAGAILEAYCDILASAIKQRMLKQTAQSAEWTLVDRGAEWDRGVPFQSIERNDPLQSLVEPGKANDRDFQISHMSDFIIGNDIILGIHRNAGILSSAFYKMSLTLGTERAIVLWLEALKELSSKSFRALAGSLRATAGESGPVVSNSLQEVGL